MKCELSDFAIFKNGKKRPNAPGAIPVYGGNGVLGYTNCNNNSRCVIVGRVGAYCGSVYYENGKCWISDNAIAVNARDNADIKFIYYLLKSLNLNKSHIGTSQPLLTQAILNIIECDLPDLETQKRIAKVLSALDDKIELNNQINKNLEEQAQALYQQMFETIPYSSRRICKADECFDISIGKTPPRKEPEWFSFNPTDVNWVSISDMGNCGLYISSSSERLTLDAVKQHNIKMVPDNTVLLSFKLTVGRVAITNGEMTTNEAIAHFKTENKDIVEYLYFYLKGFNFQTMGSTSSIAVAVNSKMIKAMPFVMPDTEKLLQFHSVVGPMFAEIKANQVASNKLKELRDSLLPKLMSGEIDVDNVKI